MNKRYNHTLIQAYRQMISSGASQQQAQTALQGAAQAALAGGPQAVQQFMTDNGFPQNGEAWCGKFAASVVHSVGLVPPRHPEVASNWRNFGPIDVTPRVGDVAIRRGVPTGSTGSHVTFVGGVNPRTGQFTAYGGNQGVDRYHPTVVGSYPIGQYEYRRPQLPPGQSINPAAPIPRAIAVGSPTPSPTPAPASNPALQSSFTYTQPSSLGLGPDMGSFGHDLNFGLAPALFGNSGGLPLAANQTPIDWSSGNWGANGVPSNNVAPNETPFSARDYYAQAQAREGLYNPPPGEAPFVPTDTYYGDTNPAPNESAFVPTDTYLPPDASAPPPDRQGPPRQAVDRNGIPLDWSNVPVANLSDRPQGSLPPQMAGGVGTAAHPAFYYSGVPGSFSAPQTYSKITQYLGNPSSTANFAGGIAGTLGGNNSWSNISTGHSFVVNPGTEIGLDSSGIQLGPAGANYKRVGWGMSTKGDNAGAGGGLATDPRRIYFQDGGVASQKIQDTHDAISIDPDDVMAILRAIQEKHRGPQIEINGKPGKEHERNPDLLLAGGLGQVPGIDQGVDSVPAMLEPGEMVVNKRQQKALTIRKGKKGLLRPDQIAALYHARTK